MKEAGVIYRNCVSCSHIGTPGCGAVGSGRLRRRWGREFYV